MRLKLKSVLRIILFVASIFVFALEVGATNFPPTLLDQAVKRGDIADIICWACRHPEWLNRKNPEGLIPLFCSPNLEVVKCIEKCLKEKRGLDISMTDEDGRTLLFYAQTPEIVDYCFEKGLAADKPDKNGYFPFHTLVLTNIAVVKQFLKHTGNGWLSLPNPFFKVPLQIVAINDKKALEEHRFDVHKRLYYIYCHLKNQGAPGTPMAEQCKKMGKYDPMPIKIMDDDSDDYSHFEFYGLKWLDDIIG